ncbi:hypothetical protein [Pseudochelatococcus contaminans]|uniref:hypothetical protein n=1 Tax=Pseudochelatococcus contaminans TaxID=1538103 RepID=UPI001AED79E9|nr:hypothetical protein [Pseudochelatococcus contaminans]
MDILQKISLATGEITVISRDTVSDKSIDICAELLDGVLLGSVLPVPGAGEYVIDGSHYRDDLKVTLWFGNTTRRMPILTAGVARGPTSGLALWREMHRSASTPLATQATLPPKEPWLANRPEPGLREHPESASWTGEWLHCLGWTWMEYGRDRLP